MDFLSLEHKDEKVKNSKTNRANFDSHALQKFTVPE